MPTDIDPSNQPIHNLSPPSLRGRIAIPGGFLFFWQQVSSIAGDRGSPQDSWKVTLTPPADPIPQASRLKGAGDPTERSCCRGSQSRWLDPGSFLVSGRTDWPGRYAVGIKGECGEGRSSLPRSNIPGASSGSSDAKRDFVRGGASVQSFHRGELHHLVRQRHEPLSGPT